jgi:hypothetical protein
MSRTMVALLAREMENAWRSFCDALDGLSDDEYRWRPTDDTLTLDDLLPADSEQWRSVAGLSGPAGTEALAYNQVVEREFFARFPIPPPLSTIEHKIGHVAVCKIMYAEYAFRDGRLRWRWSDLGVPRSLNGMRGYLEDAHQTLRGYVDGLADPDLQVPRKTNWGDLWPTERILWTLIQHDGYHGGQIRTMRAFYRAARRPASRPRV